MKKTIATILFLTAVGAGCGSNAANTTGHAEPSVPQAETSVEPKADSPVDQALDLSGQGLTSIPMEVFSRTDLVSLDLSNNKLTGAPQSQIGQLKKLKRLNLSGNDLTGLPAELGQLTKLETLDVSDNRLTGLPNELGNLTQLQTFKITGNDYSAQDMDGIAAKLIHTNILR